MCDGNRRAIAPAMRRTISRSSALWGAALSTASTFIASAVFVFMFGPLCTARASAKSGLTSHCVRVERLRLLATRVERQRAVIRVPRPASDLVEQEQLDADAVP